MATARRRIELGLAFALIALAACSGGSGSTDQGQRQPDSTARTTDDPSDTPADDPNQHGTDTRPAECGNGVVEDGEQCDEGDRVGGDGCSADCQIEGPDPDATCGDDVCSGGETAESCPDDCQCEDGAIRVACLDVMDECHFRDHPRFAGDCAGCLNDGTGRWPECAGVADCWETCEDGRWVADAWCAGGCEAPDPEETCACPQAADANNFCHLPPRTEGCPMTYPGGYCDPNGDASYEDGDWDRGWFEFRDRCPPNAGDPDQPDPPDPVGDCDACGEADLHVRLNDDMRCGCAEQWRVVWIVEWQAEVSQVCRGGEWLNFNWSPRDPAACCGGDFQGCCQYRDPNTGCW